MTWWGMQMQTHDMTSTMNIFSNQKPVCRLDVVLPTSLVDLANRTVVNKRILI